MPSAGPDTSMRGPSISPALMPSRTATSVKPLAPTLRIVVKPARNVRRAFLTPVTASRGVEIPTAAYPALVGSAVTWVCTSINPGRHVADERSIGDTPAGAFVDDAAPTAVMEPLS